MHLTFLLVRKGEVVDGSLLLKKTHTCYQEGYLNQELQLPEGAA